MAQLESDPKVRRILAAGKRPALRLARRALIEGGAALGRFYRRPSECPRFNRSLDCIDTAIADLHGLALRRRDV